MSRTLGLRPHSLALVSSVCLALTVIASARRHVLIVLVAVLGTLALASPASVVAATTHPYLSQISGIPGEAFDERVCGVAVDPANQDVYVADPGKGAIDIFSSGGVYQSQISIGTSGQFNLYKTCSVAVSDTTGDVYVADAGYDVVDVFNAMGAFVEKLNASFGGETLNVAVAPSTGDVYVADSASDVVDTFNSANEYQSQFVVPSAPTGVATSSSANIYVATEGSGGIYEYSAGGTQIAEITSTPGAPFVSLTGVAVDSAGNVYVADSGAGQVDEFNSSRTFVTRVEHSFNEYEYESVAVNGTGDLYVANGASPTGAAVGKPKPGLVDVFGPSLVVVPGVTTTAASSVQPRSATLNGAVNPAGVQVTSCYFEYGTSISYGQTAPCVRADGTGSDIGAGTAPVAVTARVSGLTPDVPYHFRLAAANANGSEEGADETFAGPLISLVESESVSNVLPTEATLSAQINPLGVQTSYHFEYGTTTAYGISIPVPDAIVGAGSTDTAATQVLSGLAPETVYHYRVVVSSANGNDAGPDRTFSTYPVSGSFQLPDNRAYEMVTSTQKNGLDALGSTDTTFASPSGDAVAFFATGSLPGSYGAEASQPRYIASRGGSGWVTHGTLPPSVVKVQDYLQSIFPDLSKVFVQSLEPQLAPGAPAGEYATYEQDVATGAYTYFAPALVKAEPHFAVAGVTPDDAHFIFESSSRLLPAATAGVTNLYEWSNGQIGLVGVLPVGEAGGAPAGGSVAGALGAQGREYTQAEHALSGDGSRVFFTDPGTGNLYVRKNADTASSSTALVAATARFQAATADGSLVFFTKSNEAHSGLYVYNVQTEQTSDIAPNGNLEFKPGNFESIPRSGVLGAGGGSGDAYVYFAAEGALTGAAVAGQPNIYVAHYDGTSWTTNYITTLHFEGEEGSDRENWNNNTFTQGPETIQKESRVTPDGRSLLFRSGKSLTGYDNRGHNELYVYDAASGRLSCVSCAPSGAVGVAETYLLGGEGEGKETARDGLASAPAPASPEVLTHNLSADGSRVFFDTEQSLLPQDTNGVKDVYEWERGGAGSCVQAGGCLFLLSTGQSTDGSFLADASESGGDVFIFTHQQLVPEDQDELQDIYDVRVNGGAVRVAAPACSGTGCQGVPPAPPIFATPSSATFSGVGNFAPTPPVKKKGKAKSRFVRCKRGFVKKHGKCAKQRSTKKRAKSNRRGK
jgi:DNA-binding beta-propeller fold protein YncE